MKQGRQRLARAFGLVADRPNDVEIIEPGKQLLAGMIGLVALVVFVVLMWSGMRTPPEIETGGLPVENSFVEDATPTPTAEPTIALQSSVDVEDSADPDVEIVASPTVESEDVVTAPSAIADGEIRFAVPPGLQETFSALAEEFNAQNSGVQVTITEFDVFFSSNVKEMVGFSDCFVLNVHGHIFPDPVAELSTFTVANDTLSQQFPDMAPGGYSPAAVALLSHDDVQYGVPAWLSFSSQLSYDPLVFANAGVPEPTDDWTWTQFAETVNALSSGEGESQVFGFGVETISVMMNQAAIRTGADWIDLAAEPPRLDYMQLEAALLQETEFARSSGYIDLARSADDEDLLATLRDNGQLAMWQDGIAGMTVFPSVALPHDESGAGTYATIRSLTAYFVHADRVEQAACGEWISWLIEKPDIAPTSIPAKLDVAFSDEFATFAGEQRASTLRYLLNADHVVTDGYDLPDWLSAGKQWLATAFYAVIDDDAAVTDALAEAQAIFDVYRECISAEADPNDRNTINQCSQLADPDSTQ